MKEYKFKNGMVTIVDNDVYERMLEFKWSCNMDVHSGNYYVTTQRKKEVNGVMVWRKYSLVEFIMGKAPDGMQIDHRARESLDNRRDNLRFCTRSENLSNRGKFKKCSSKYKGVVRKYSGSYAQIMVDGVNHYLGRFDTEQEAALAYNKAALKFFGDYACINLDEELF